MCKEAALHNFLYHPSPRQHCCQLFSLDTFPWLLLSSCSLHIEHFPQSPIIPVHFPFKSTVKICSFIGDGLRRWRGVWVTGKIAILWKFLPNSSICFVIVYKMVENEKLPKCWHGEWINSICALFNFSPATKKIAPSWPWWWEMGKL